MAASATAPLAQKERIDVIDIIRGVALLGILLMNIPYFSNPHHFQSNPLLNKDFFAPANYYTWWGVNGLFEGTMRGLFTMLFGAGSLLLLSRLEARSGMAADIFYRRLLWLLLFGMINAFVFLWPGDILYSYAICGLLIFPFRNMKGRSLLIIAIALISFTFLKDTYSLYESKFVAAEGEKILALEKAGENLSADQQELKGYYMKTQGKYNIETMEKESQAWISKMQGDYFSVWGHLRFVNVWLQSTKFYSHTFLDIMSLLFLGMALLKMNIMNGRRSKGFFLKLMLVSYAVGLASSYWFLKSKLNAGFVPGQLADHAIVDLYQIKRTFLTMGHLSLLVLLYQYRVFSGLLRLLRNVGQMAFTNYLMQSIICVTIFYGFGFGLFGKLQIHQQYYVVAAVWAFQILFSAVWLKYYRFGPFEWVWRSLTYWKKQPMKRKPPSSGEEEVVVEQEEKPVPLMA